LLDILHVMLWGKLLLSVVSAQAREGVDSHKTTMDLHFGRQLLKQMHETLLQQIAM